MFIEVEDSLQPNNMYRFELSLLSLLSILPFAQSASTYTLVSTWPGGFQAELCITNKMNVKCGWTVALDFNPKISMLNIWNVKIVNTTDVTNRKVRYVVTNLSYNQKIKWNQNLCLGFVARYSNNQWPNIRKMTGKFMYRCRVPTTPAPVTTTPVTTRKATTEAATTTPVTTPKATTEAATTTPVTTPEVTTEAATTTTVTTPKATTEAPTTTPVTTTATTEAPTTISVTTSTSTTEAPTTTPTVTSEATTVLPTTTLAETSANPTTQGETTTSEEISTSSTTSSTTPQQTTTSESVETTDSGITTEAPVGRFDYKRVLELSILFYEAQRSGKLTAANRVPWRGDSALGDKGDNNEDLTGGWYDAGDYIKFTFPMSSAVTYLLWGLLRWPDSYQDAGQLDHMYDSVKWPLDYFLKSWNGTTREFYAQVGLVSLDHNYWGRPEHMTMLRPAFKVTKTGPGSDVSAQTATALTMGYLVFKNRDAVYADTMLTAAKELYSFAKTYQGIYSNTITDAVGAYSSNMFTDELALAAVWLHKATGEMSYLTEAESFVPLWTPWSLDWSDKIAAAQLALYEVTGDNKYKSAVEAFMTSYMPGGNVPYTPGGLVYRLEWGPLRYAANVAMFALMAADDGINPNEYRKWALTQIHYILGDNNDKRSYIIGFGDKYPLRPHHAASSCPDKPASCTWDQFHSSDPNPQILLGGMVGGPDNNDVYIDDRKNYQESEVACDYNSGMQSAIAGIIHLQLTNQLPEVDGNVMTTPSPAEQTTLTPLPVTDLGPTGPTVAPGSSSAYNLSEVLELSILFYEAQRSGKLPETNRVSWRKDSALGDKGENNKDLTGGWYDAGDHIKFTFPMSAAVMYLLLGLHHWKDAYVASNQLDNMYDSVKWPLDYFLKCWNPQTEEFYVQVGIAFLDHAEWARAESMTMERPAYKVGRGAAGSDVAAGSAAAMALGAIVFQSKDPEYASRLLTAANGLYTFAKTYLGKYTDTVTEAAGYYDSDNYNDELALAAVWLYRATGQQHYLTEAESHAAGLLYTPWALDWSDKSAIVHLALYEETQSAMYRDVIMSFMTSYLPGGSVSYTPCGLAWRSQWGSLRYTANVAMFALLAADAGIEPQTYRSWALGQMSYMLGENNYDLSYVVGYSNKYPLRPHHQNSACGLPPAPCDWGTFNSPAPNVNVLKGALVGGPYLQDVYTDDRTDYISNEVSCDYNSGMQSAVAGLLHLEITDSFPVSSLSPSPTCARQ